MIHPPGAKLIKAPWLTQHEPIAGRRIYLTKSRLTNAGEGAFITIIGTVAQPHRIDAVHIRSNQTPNPDRLIDALLSDNDSTLAAAQVTDLHLSGLTGLNAGLFHDTSNTRIPIGRLNSRPLTHYKMFTYNNSASNSTALIMLELTMLGAR